MTLKEKLACCAGAAVSALAMVACSGLLSQGKAAWSVGVIASMALAVILSGQVTFVYVAPRVMKLFAP